jgi:TRL-like protein family
MNRSLIAGLMFAAMGCTGAMYPAGILYNNTQVPHISSRTELTGMGKTGDKSGEACVTGLFWLFAWGDASTDTAKKLGGITEVHSVENQFTSVLLGIYAKGCTVVHGK